MYTPKFRNQQGFGLVETMVGLVISLLVGLAAFNSATFFTSMQKQSVGAGSMTSNLGTTLSLVEYSLSQAGLGFYADSAFSCPRLNYSKGATRLLDGSSFAPLKASTVNSLSDQLEVLYATSILSGAAVKTRSGLNLENTLALESALPAAVGATVLLVPSDTSLPCTVRTVTQVAPGEDGQGPAMSFDNTGASNQATFSTEGAYPAASKVTLLGGLQWQRLRLSGTDLVLEQPSAGTSVVLVRNVVAFKIRLGVTTAASTTTVSQWVSPTGTWADLTSSNILKLRAVQVGVVVRSDSAEKADSAGNCSATTSAPMLFGAALTLPTNWQCYRYRSGEQTIPLRNFNAGSAT